MATEPERYLRKARESLASAQADVRGRRYNSAANRAYYAAFQAAVAALIHFRVRKADTEWQHRFVSEEFSGKLITWRKVFEERYRETLNELFAVRIIGDYRDLDVSARKAREALRDAASFVESVTAKLGRRGTAEESTNYGTSAVKARTAARPRKLVADLEATIKGDYPDVEIRVTRRGARDYTMDVYGITDERFPKFKKIYGLTSDILVDHDVWIVVLPLPYLEN